MGGYIYVWATQAHLVLDPLQQENQTMPRDQVMAHYDMVSRQLDPLTTFIEMPRKEDYLKVLDYIENLWSG